MVFSLLYIYHQRE